MATNELLKSENLFIRLFNQGKSIDEIASSLGVNADIVTEWHKNLVYALEDSDYPDSVKTSISAKNEDGTYQYNNTFKFELDGRERVRMGLWMIASRSLEPENSKIFHINKLINEAQQHLDTVEKYLKDVYFERDEKEFTYKYTIYSLAIGDDVAEKLDKAIRFFIQHVLRFDDRDQSSRLISQSSVDTYSVLANSLNYCIKQIKIQDYLDIKNTTIENIPIDSKWIFVTGENGYGKTSFLQAIAIGLIGSEDEGSLLLDRKKSKIGIEYKYDNENKINNINTRNFEVFDHLLCYGPSRLQIQAKMSQNEIGKQSSTTYNLFNSDGILLNIESSLVIWHLDNKERFNQAKSIFKKIIPSLHDIIIEKNNQGDFEVYYVEQDDDQSNQVYSPVSYNKLATGLRNIMAMVGDMLVRYIRKHPDTVDLSSLSGIVLIDELENHLHPKWQYQLPSLLSTTFPEVQFIATTHSVIPILGAPTNSIFLKLKRTKEEGVVVEQIKIDVSNLLPNSILTSPIFDMDTILPLSNQNFNQLRTEETYDQVIDNNKVNERLKSFELANQNYPDALFE